MNKGTLPHGLKLGEQVHKDFELRPLETGHVYDAEDMVDPSKPIKFAGALLCQQLVRIGTFEGPFTLELLRKLKPADVEAMQNVRLAMGSEGEAEQPD